MSPRVDLHVGGLVIQGSDLPYIASSKELMEQGRFDDVFYPIRVRETI